MTTKAEYARNKRYNEKLQTTLTNVAALQREVEILQFATPDEEALTKALLLIREAGATLYTVAELPES